MHVLHVVPGLTLAGGREKVAIQLIRGLRRRGLRVDVLTSSSAKDAERLVRDGSNDAFFNVPRRSLAAGSMYFDFYWNALRNHDCSAYDIVHCHAPVAVWKRSHVRHIVYTVHSVQKAVVDSIASLNKCFGPLERRVRHVYPIPIHFERQIIRTAEAGGALGCVSSQVLNEIEQHYGYDGLARIVPNTVQLTDPGEGTWDSIPPRAGPRMAGRARDTIVIGTVANRLTGKNLRSLVCALPRLEADDVVLRVIGDLQAKQCRQLEDWAVESGIAPKTIECIGRVEPVASALQGLDVAVFPSIYESFGLAFVEAVSAGVPTVVTGVHGSLEFIPALARQWIAILPQGTPEAIARAVTELRRRGLLDERSRSETRKRQDIMRTWIARSNENALEGYVRLYNEVISRSRL